MLLLRIFLVLAWLLLVGYTALVGLEYGFNLLPIFFGDMAAITWPGQFNLDFMLLLTLSGLWAAWRGGFTVKSMAWGLVLTVGGALVLLPYLLWLSYQTQGNISRLLLGKHLT